MGGPVDTTARLANLRKAMKKRNIDVYIIPSEDAHSSEYIADCDARRQWISGFTGSAGCAVVTHDKAALATDGRYFNQAAQELDANWTLLKQGIQDVPSWERWAADESAGGKLVGVDPTLLSSGTATKLAEKIKKCGGVDLISVPENLVDLCWAPMGKPARPTNPVVFLEDKFTGKGTKEKLAYLRKELEKKKSSGFVVSMLDEIAWLFNLRGSDIPYNPVFFSYALVTPDSATLYVDSSKLSDACQRYLSENDVEVKPYDTIFADSEALASSARVTNGTTEKQNQPKFLISSRASWALNLALGGKDLVEELRSPVGDAKAVKTDTELEGMRQCHIRDGVALIKYFAWLEQKVWVEKVQMDEVAAADNLEGLRKQQKDFVGLSFPTISATGPNAAIIHYKPQRGDCATIEPNAVYLCDSGAQYLDGTTDTTRTLHFGKPTDMEKKGYTLVLKGNMALDMAKFPRGTTGFAIDAFARQFLWQEGLDYRHGTGHGVGSYLNVHEGPIGIGTRKHYVDVALAAGNVTSIEPGYYEDGSFGIRIENMALIKEVKTTHQFDDKAYLGFEHVTVVPYCRALIDTSLLTEREKRWLNEYNELVWEKTSGLVADDAVALAYLKRETQPF